MRPLAYPTMATALPRFISSRGRPVACPCRNPDEEQFLEARIDGALPGEFELPTAGDVEWLLFSYT